MAQYERWYKVEEGNLYEIIENDGHAFMRKGAERMKILLCTVEEAVEAYPKELSQATGVTNGIREQTQTL